MRKVLPWVIALLVLGAGGYFGWRYLQGRKTAEVTFRTSPVERRRITARVTASGTLSALVTVQVGSQVSGRIQQISVDYNTPVKKGQLIAKIDPQLFQASVAQAQASWGSAKAGLVRAQAQAHEADRVYVRQKALYEQNLSSKTDLDAAETNLAVAKSQIDVANAALQQASASLNLANVNLSYTNIYSPIDGIVLSRNVDVGQTVAASLQAPVLFTIAEDLKKMLVDTSVAESDIGRLESGMKAFFTVDAFPGQRFRGELTQIRNAAKTVQNVVTYDAVVAVDNSDLRLRPGMTANVTFVFAEKSDVLAVANAALRFKPPPEALGSASAAHSASGGPSASASARTGRPPRGAWGRGDGGAPPFDPDGLPRGALAKEKIDKRTVYVLRGGIAVPVDIEVGLSDGTVTEVVSGDLKEGDEVVTDAQVAGKAPPAPTGGGGGGPGGRSMRMF